MFCNDHDVGLDSSWTCFQYYQHSVFQNGVRAMDLAIVVCLLDSFKKLLDGDKYQTHLRPYEITNCSKTQKPLGMMLDRTGDSKTRRTSGICVRLPLQLIFCALIVPQIPH